jgi:hypothetical protein
MKSDHRHELKTNELAEWIANFPQWAKENRITIIVVLLVIAVAGFLYIWKIHSRNISIQEQIELTKYMSQLLGAKAQIVNAQARGKDLSYILLQPANNLKSFAQTVKDDRMTAFALIKRADALRTELHYRPGPVSEQDFTTQINLAKDSYNEAIEKASLYPSLMAAAKFGIGLCEEEMDNFETAQQIYQDVATNPDFEGTVAKAAAKQRLKTMADYKTKVAFQPSAKPKVKATPIDINNLPIEIKQKLPAQKAPVTNLEPNLPSAD